jgi:hypothetical protein
MKTKLISILIILVTISCSSVNLIKEPITPLDEEKLGGFTPENLQIKNKKLLVTGYSVLKDYKDVMTAQTVEIVSNAGGAEVVQLRDLLTKEQEAKILEAQLNKDVAVNQKLGTDDGIFKSAKDANKGIDFGLVVRLKAVRTEVDYTPEECTTKDGKTTCTDPNWKAILEADVDYTLRDFKTGEDIQQGLTDHVYVKNFNEEPSAAAFTVMMPRVLEYCFEDILPIVQTSLPFSSTVIAMKGEKKYALISAGANNKVQPGRVFEIKEGEETIASIKIFQVNQKESWGKVSGDREKLKIGMKGALKPQSLSLGYRIFRWFYQRSGLDLRDLLD